MKLKRTIVSAIFLALGVAGQSCTKDEQSVEEVVSEDAGELTEEEIIEASEQAAQQMEDQMDSDEYGQQDQQEGDEMASDDVMSDDTEDMGLTDSNETIDADPTYAEEDGLSYSDDSAGEIADNEDDQVEFESAYDASVADEDSEVVDVTPESMPAQEEAYEAPVATSTPSDKSYIVQPGDTLSIIATKLYGNGSLWRKVADENNLASNSTIYPGDSLNFDGSNTQANSYVDNFYSNMKTVTVEQGDTLSSISQRLFGNGNAWKFLYQINNEKISNPDMIYVGQVLKYADLDGGQQLSH